MSFTVETAVSCDADEVAQLYDAVIDHLNEHTNYPGWAKGIYPAKEDAEQGINEQCLFVARDHDNGKIAGTIILRHTPEEAYHTVTWKKDLSYDEVYVIYTFAVHPDYQSKGVGSYLLSFAEEYARANGAQSLRLDVVAGNVPAIKCYKRFGFEYISTVDLGYADLGLPWYELYEKVL